MMAPGPSEQQQSLGNRLPLIWKRRITWIALYWEALWRSFWAPIALLLIAVSIVVSGIMAWLPEGGRIGLLAGLAAIIIMVFGLAFRRFQAPDQYAADRRLETENGLTHRPLTGSNDRLVLGATDRDAEKLWQAHQSWLREKLRGLPIPLPKATLPLVDPKGLFAVALLIFLVALFLPAGTLSDRLALALPRILPSMEAAQPRFGIEGWISPPDYTGKAPIFLSNSKVASLQSPSSEAEIAEIRPLEVPEGSRILLQLSHKGQAPRLEIGELTHSFEVQDENLFRIEAPIFMGDHLTIREGADRLISWPILVIPDSPPQIDFTQPPTGTAQASLRLDYQASDDYGLRKVEAHIKRADGLPDPAGEIEIALNLPLPAPYPQKARMPSFHDLAAHPWAGMAVEIELRAMDGNNQWGRSRPLAGKLPERYFTHPVARAIIEERKAINETQHREDRIPIAQRLSALGNKPEDFAQDFIVSLALRIAALRLSKAEEPAAVKDVQQILWQTALRIEEGGVASARDRLRELQKELQDAIANGASDEEIEKLMEEMKQALNEYLNNLQQQMQQALQDGRLQEMPMTNPDAMTRRDLQEMLNEMQKMLEGGARDAAREMLSQFQQLLENMRPMPYAGQPNSQESREMTQAMRDLQSLLRRQQELMDRTFRQGQQGEQGQPQGENSQPGDNPQQGNQGENGQNPQSGQNGQGGPSSQSGENGPSLPGEQRNIGDGLGELMDRLGKLGRQAPSNFGEAQQAMRNAERLLEQGDYEGAGAEQNKALEALRDGYELYAQQMMRQYGLIPSNRTDDPGYHLSPRYDPLERLLEDEGLSDGQVTIPEESDLQRARELRDELRRRWSEPERPKLERDYIDRLLKQF